jgi:hypothetical protein
MVLVQKESASLIKQTRDSSLLSAVWECFTYLSVPFKLGVRHMK